MRFLVVFVEWLFADEPVDDVTFISVLNARYF